MGALASIAGFAVGNWQRIAIYALLASLVLGAAAGWGYMRGVQRLYDYEAKQVQATVKVILKQGAVTERVITRYIRVKEATDARTQTINTEVVRYVEKNAGFCLDADWRRLHDAAATGILPPPATGADGPGTAPRAAEALETIGTNYGKANTCADRLDALQEWVRGQAAANP